MSRSFQIAVIILIAAPLLSSYAQEKDPRELFAESIFNEDTPLDVELISDMHHFRKEKFEDEYQPAYVRFTVADGTILEDSIRIKARGNFRRKTCYYPPVRLNFKKSAFTPKDTSSFLDKIKLVSICKSSPQYEQYVVKEYLVYKMYELITDYSIRARFMNIKFVDVFKEKMKEKETVAFILEDIDEVAYRKNAMEFDMKNLQEGSVYPEIIVDLLVFQFMIGNTDYSIPGVHNFKYLKIKDPTIFTPVVVPYDFDYCGFVNADYAIPNPVVPIQKVTQRIYWGLCRPRADFEKSFAKFRELRPQFESIIRDCQYLDDNNKRAGLAYIEDFYEIINDERKVTNYFINGCRKK